MESLGSLNVPGNVAGPGCNLRGISANFKDIHDTPGRHAEILALICTRRASNIAFLSVPAAISGLTFQYPRTSQQWLTAP